MLLSRVAENVYWAARYLERAESTARIVREHTNLLVDMPTSAPLNWEPLLGIVGLRDDFDGRYEHADERSIIRFLVADHENSSSVLRSVEAARENLRTTREVLPRELWLVVNDLYLFVASNHGEGVSRSTRLRFLDRIVGDGLKVAGIVDSTMSRDETRCFLQLGRLVERADMTTRVLDVRAGGLLDRNGDQHAYDTVQWMGVLRALSALQMFQRTVHRGISGEAALSFCLFDRAFPRAVAFCLDAVLTTLAPLPNASKVARVCEQARTQLSEIDVDGLDSDDLHEIADRLQLAIASVHDALASTYFLPTAALA